MKKIHYNKKSIQSWIKRLSRPMNIIAITGGGFLGYLFYYYTSCCADEMVLDLNPLITIIYGGMTGMIISFKC